MHSNEQDQAFKGDILIVDDTPDNLRFLSTTLVERGYEVRCVLNGAMALTSARTSPPTLILLDIKMSDLDGYEVCQQLKASPATSDIPVIFLSALDEAINKVRAFAVGGVDYITKPFQVEEVIARIENQMALQSAKAEIFQLNAQLLEQRVRERTAQLEKANRAKSIFIAHMSHELRTPLNGILGFAQILQKDPNLSSQQLDGLKTIQQCGYHLLTLIEDLLDTAKIEAKKLKLKESDCYFSDLIKSLIAITNLKAQNKGIAFIYQPQSTLPNLVRGDEKRLRQVLLNLLSNAVKFTETGSVFFKVGYVEDKEDREDREDGKISSPSPIFPSGETVCSSRGTRPTQLSHNQQSKINNQKIRFQVEDTGIGIPPEKLADIFMPFQQVVKGQFAREGTGLGLTISQNIVQQMGGEIQVESTLGQGSRFWFEIDLPEIKSSQRVKPTDSPPRIISFKGQAPPILMGDNPTIAPTQVAVNQDSGEDSTSSPLIAPPREELTVLLELAKQGNIGRILERAAIIEQLSSQYLPFAQRIRQLAESFQEKKLRQFIEKQIQEGS